MLKPRENDFVKVEMTLDRFEGECGVLIAGKEEVAIPQKLLPEDLQEGDVVYFSIASEAAERRQKEKRAKELLNEILGANSPLDEE